MEALAYLASDVERLGRFLALTGLSPDTIRAAAASPGFLAAVLDHLAEDESLLVAFAANADRDPSEVLAARARLGPPTALACARAESWPWATGPPPVLRTAGTA